ncbi:MAG TPA: TolC family protein [Chthoniobacterales bacterium]
MMKFLSILFLLALSAGLVQAGNITQGTLTLDVVTAEVLASNPTIHEANAKWEALKQRVPQAAAWDDLRISARSRVGRFVHMDKNGMVDQTLGVEQMIPISGKNKSRERIAAAEALAGLEEMRRKELDVVNEARASFFRLAKAYALLDLNQANETSLNQTLQISRARFETGGQSQADVLIAENELTRIQEARRDLEQARSDEQTRLGVLMNRDPFAPLGRPALTPLLANAAGLSLERVREQLFANRPEIRMAEAGLVAAKSRLELARREWIPDPALSVEAGRYNDASQAVSEIAVGVSFNVPWLNGKKYRAGEREAGAGIAAATQAVESARTSALGLLRDQLKRIETFHHHVELFRDTLIPVARQTVEANRANYSAGRGSFLEVVLSERNLRDLESTAREHLADYQSAIAALESIIGAPPRPIPASTPTKHIHSTKNDD